MGVKGLFNFINQLDYIWTNQSHVEKQEKDSKQIVRAILVLLSLICLVQRLRKVPGNQCINDVPNISWKLEKCNPETSTTPPTTTPHSVHIKRQNVSNIMKIGDVVVFSVQVWILCHVYWIINKYSMGVFNVGVCCGLLQFRLVFHLSVVQSSIG